MNKVQSLTLHHDFDGQDARFSRAYSLLSQGIAQRATPGAVVCVTRSHKLIAWKAHGHLTYDSGAPAVHPDTLFDLASVTKAVATTTAAMLLHETQALRLDTKVSAFFEAFRRGAKKEVTVAMLLSHSSGLPGYEKLFLRCRSKEELAHAAAETPLSYAPGARSEYSDLGFILLGEIISQTCGQSLSQFAAETIFLPLGMLSATYCPAFDLRANIPPTQEDTEFRHRIIQGEVDDENASIMGGVAGHAGLFASAYDVAKFAECMLRKGAPIFKPETVRLFTTRQPNPVGTHFGLGWDTPSPPSQSGHRLSSRAFGHLGYTGTSLWIDPDRQLSITLLTNRTWPNRESQQIKQLRPAVHDAIVEAIDET